MELPAIPRRQSLADQHARHRQRIIVHRLVIAVAGVVGARIHRRPQASAIGRHAFTALGFSGIRRHAALVDLHGRRRDAPGALRHAWALVDVKRGHRVRLMRRLGLRCLFGELGFRCHRTGCQHRGNHHCRTHLAQAVGHAFGACRQRRRKKIPVGAVHSHRPEVIGRRMSGCLAGVLTRKHTMSLCAWSNFTYIPESSLLSRPKFPPPRLPL
ncbi:hypothetical protein SDC9_83355 [bioreactor metagenome]|uniref:Uncharacterized protein n=1 Tax=bioreactor metagenome TaxID=1076179 RepID=A0A644ZDH1_9ZZZZ